MSATTRDFYGFTSTVTYARLILSACAKDPLPPGFVTPLPARHAALTTIRHYFENFFVMYPLFEEASFYASIDAVYSSDSDKSSLASPFDHFSVRMVLAIAHAGRMEQRGDGDYMSAIGHVSAALMHAEHVLRPGSLASVQAMLLLHEYAMIDPHHFDSWGLIGAASRAMVDLGLHQDPPKSTTISKAKLELRRRVFWSVINMDYGLAHSLGRSSCFAMSQEHIDVKWYECADDHFITPEGVKPKAPQSLKKWISIHFHKMRLHQLEIRRKLYQKKRDTPKDENDPWFIEMENKIQEWKDASPEDTIGTGLDKAW